MLTYFPVMSSPNNTDKFYNSSYLHEQEQQFKQQYHQYHSQHYVKPSSAKRNLFGFDNERDDFFGGLPQRTQKTTSSSMPIPTAKSNRKTTVNSEYQQISYHSVGGHTLSRQARDSSNAWETKGQGYDTTLSSLSSSPLRAPSSSQQQQQQQQPQQGTPAVQPWGSHFAFPNLLPSSRTQQAGQFPQESSLFSEPSYHQDSEFASPPRSGATNGFYNSNFSPPFKNSSFTVPGTSANVAAPQQLGNLPLGSPPSQQGQASVGGKPNQLFQSQRHYPHQELESQVKVPIFHRQGTQIRQHSSQSFLYHSGGSSVSHGDNKNYGHYQHSSQFQHQQVASNKSGHTGNGGLGGRSIGNSNRGHSTKSHQSRGGMAGDRGGVHGGRHWRGHGMDRRIVTSQTCGVPIVSATNQVTHEPSATRVNYTESNKNLLQQFLERLKDIENEQEEDSYDHAKMYVHAEIHRVSENSQWKVYLELAEFAKRENRMDDARHYYQMVNTMEPKSAQGWIDHAKLEEENGELERCESLLKSALEVPSCRYNESLLIKFIKLQEQMGNIQAARGMLSRLKNVNIEKSWKIILEGAMLESRCGNIDFARQIFKYLMTNVPRHGPIYYEAYRLEEKCENYEKALEIVEKGLEQNPRYGPLWFANFHLLEQLGKLVETEGYNDEKNEGSDEGRFDEGASLSLFASNPTTTEGSANNLTTNVSSNTGDDNGIEITPLIVNNSSCPPTLQKIRDTVERAVKSISRELLWKVFLESAQIEERAGNIEEARQAYVHAIEHAQENLRWKVWLAGARTELNAKNTTTARMLLSRALNEVPSKSKAVVLIECARLEEYVGEIEKARKFLKRAQNEAKHEWKVFLESILLEMRAGDISSAIEEAELALSIHRGTGRLWAVLIQLKHINGEDEQFKVFTEALNEVPKSGEVWCEGARMYLNPLSNRFNLTIARRFLEFAIKFTPQYGDSLIEYLRLELLEKGPKIEEEENKYIERLCVGTDPNYGPLWNHCKEHPLDSTRQVLKHARDMIRSEIIKFCYFYQRAILRQAAIEDNKVVPSGSSPNETSTTTAATSASSSYNESEDGANMIKGKQYSTSDFITGLHSLNVRLLRKIEASDQDDNARKKSIFQSSLYDIKVSM